MRYLPSFVTTLATAALCAAAVTPAAAQHAAAPDYVRPVVNHATPTTDAALVRMVAVYQFGASHEVGMPTQVTVADSAGRLVAAFRLRDGAAVRPMAVQVVDNDIMLQGQTPWGMLTLVLYSQNDSDAASDLAGAWSLGDRQGELRGRAVR
jgi:hypothetical protein